MNTQMAQPVTVEEWYIERMLGGKPIPEGVTIDPEDYRAQQRCAVCDEMVDAWVGTFTARHCAKHA